MSEIHIGPHTRDDGVQRPGETHHAFDREINTRAIAKWMAALLVVTVIVEIGMWWMVRGLERSDQKRDPELTPIQQEMKQPLPPVPRLQVGQNFRSTNSTLNEEADGTRDPELERVPTRSDLEDMQALRAEEDALLGSPAWIDRGQGRVRVPIDVAMKVIASRGAQAAEQMTRPQAPAQPVAAKEQ